MKNLKYFIITLSCTLICACQGLKDKKIDIENEKSKRIEFFEQDEPLQYEKSWNYQAPKSSNISMWIASDSAQTLYCPENYKVNKLEEKHTLSLKAASDPLDEVIPAPVIKDNILYVKNSEALVSAYDLESGKLKWSRYAAEDNKRKNLIGGGLFWYNDIVYCSFGSNEVIALNAVTGEEIWRTKLSSIIRTIPVYGYDKIFVRSVENKFFVLNATSGDLIYVADAGVESLVRASKAAAAFSDRGGMIIPNSLGQLDFMKHDNGEVVWSENIAFDTNPLKTMVMNDISMTPIVKGNIVYAVSQIGRLTALNLSTGNFIWGKNFGSVESFWIAGNGLFLIDDSGHLWHLNALNGLIRWKVSLNEILSKSDKDKIQFFGPVMVNDKLVIASSLGSLLEIDPAKGELISTHQIPKERLSAPVVVNGQIFLLSASGKLTILGSKLDSK